MGSTTSASSAFVVIFFLLSQLIAICSSQSPPYLDKELPKCPHFHCSSLLDPIGFPFASTSSPECGLWTINCSGNEPKAQFQKGGRWYSVKQMDFYDEKFRVYDPDLKNNFKSGQCDFLNDFTEQGSPLTFEVTSPAFYFTKCKRVGYPALPHLNQGFHTFTDCRDYDLLFGWATSKIKPIVPESHSSICSVVQLPANETMDQRRQFGNLLDLLAAEFSLKWHIVPECINCYMEGDQCVNANGKFKCEPSKTDSEMKKGSNTMRIGAAVGGGTFITVAMIFLCWRRMKYSSYNSVAFWKKKTKNAQNVEVFLKSHGTLAQKRYKYSDVKKMTNSFKDKLGQGGYGGVFKGKLLDGRMVAVKVLSETKCNGEEFINEVASISRTSHVNIVSLLGFCVEGPKRALIYEFMPNGSLEKFIYHAKPVNIHPHLGWETLYKIAMGIARGLEYLHRGCNTRILHFDIKPHNILLDKDFCPKISDFGLAKLCLVNESIISMTGARGTPGYIAPELVSRNFGGVSHKSDVYSYGMMLLEMVGRRKNINTAANTSEIYFPHWIYNRLDMSGDLGLHGVTSMEDEEITRKMIIVGLWCIQIDPSNRPPMSKVLDMLEGNLEALQVPPKPFFSSPSREQEHSSTSYITANIR